MNKWTNNQEQDTDARGPAPDHDNCHARPDGWPQATTVGYVNEGRALYFLCGLDSQKATNLARDNRVSLTIDHDTPDLMAITGLSMAVRAEAVTDRSEAENALRMLPLKYPEQAAPLPVPMPHRASECFARNRGDKSRRQSSALRKCQGLFATPHCSMLS